MSALAFELLSELHRKPSSQAELEAVVRQRASKLAVLTLDRLEQLGLVKRGFNLYRLTAQGERIAGSNRRRGKRLS